MSSSNARKVIKWPSFTDGSSSKWPGSPYQQADDSSTAESWMRKIGQIIASVMEYQNPEAYKMDGWPKGYAVYMLSRPDSIRGDYYLYGGPKKYRSAAEFQEHAIWLYFAGKPPQYDKKILFQTSMKRSRDTKQQLITEHVRVPERKTDQEKEMVSSKVETKEKPPSTKKVSFKITEFMPSSPSPTPKPKARELSVEPTISLVSPMKHPRSKSVDMEDDAPLTNSVRLLAISEVGGPEPILLPSRPQLNRHSRRYRIGELVWCAVDPPLCGESGNAVIDQWPGVIESNRVKKTVTEKGVEEEVLYEIKLLAMDDSLVLPQAMLNPYRALITRSELIEELQAIQFSVDHDLPRELYHFRQNVKNRSSQHQEKAVAKPDDLFLQASGTFSFALQIAGRLALLWSFAQPHVKNYAVDEHYTSFSAFWWGSELIYIGDMVVLAFPRSLLAQHPAASGLYWHDGSEDGCVLFQIKGISAEDRRGILTGYLYEPVKLLSSTPPDSKETLPEQPPPFGYMWKRLLPLSFQARLDIQNVVCRYYEGDFTPTIGLTQINVNNVSVLRGLSPGSQYMGTNPLEFHSGRGEMLRRSTDVAIEDLKDYWNSPPAISDS
ncbi:hypothetical protein FRC17_010020 [Serendipita sp. 399]|nr:hypothetical protein FRC17_010020 [Serendipita sp. 399]